MSDKDIVESFINKYKHVLASRLPEVRLTTAEAGHLCAVITTLFSNLYDAQEAAKEAEKHKEQHNDTIAVNPYQNTSGTIRLDGGKF